ncbi:MAG: NUDIX domain-containing protein [Candidatus Omnitrophota bacterium]
MFKYCPNCKSENISFDKLNKYSCNFCGWTYYKNVAAAVMVLLLLNYKILFTIRAREPSKGKLDLPGGFVDRGETAEQALKREIKEELNIDLSRIDYIGSAVNEYPYKGITYNTCDLIFWAKIEEEPKVIRNSEIEGYVLKNIDTINSKDLAFKSVEKAIQLFKQKGKMDA